MFDFSGNEVIKRVTKDYSLNEGKWGKRRSD